MGTERKHQGELRAASEWSGVNSPTVAFRDLSNDEQAEPVSPDAVLQGGISATVALEYRIDLSGVEPDTFDNMLQKAKTEDREVRGPVDHGFVRSIYFRDPNGYVIELTASTGVHQEIMNPAISKPHEELARWQAARSH